MKKFPTFPDVISLGYITTIYGHSLDSLMVTTALCTRLYRRYYSDKA